jgi:hypothetical protein
MTTYEAAVRLLAAETPEEKERAERAYTATWTPLAKPVKRARRKAAKPQLTDNVIDLADWKAKLGPPAQGSSVRFEKAKDEAAAMQTGSK